LWSKKIDEDFFFESKEKNIKKKKGEEIVLCWFIFEW